MPDRPIWVRAQQPNQPLQPNCQNTKPNRRNREDHKHQYPIHFPEAFHRFTPDCPQISLHCIHSSNIINVNVTPTTIPAMRHAKASPSSERYRRRKVFTALPPPYASCSPRQHSLSFDSLLSYCLFLSCLLRRTSLPYTLYKSMMLP